MPAATSRLVISGALAITMVLYPILVYVGIRSGGLRTLAVILIVIFAARLALLHKDKEARSVGEHLHVLAVAGIALAALSILSGTQDAMLYYPVVVNAALLYIFVYSLFRPPSVIERIARRTDRQFPDSAISYTRKATIAWTLFFFLNGCVSLYTVLNGSLELWTLYNGLIAYILMGGMFLGEWVVRTRIRGSRQP